MLDRTDDTIISDILSDLRSLEGLIEEIKTDVETLRLRKAPPPTYYVKVILPAGGKATMAHSPTTSFDPWYTSEVEIARGDRVMIEKGTFRGVVATVIEVRTSKPLGVPYFHPAKPYRL